MDFSNWHQFFLNNKGQFSHINWDEGPDLSEKEKVLIAKSIAQFQKGENSEGKHLMGFAKLWENQSYLETIKTFIQEEQHHAWVLGKYMEDQGLRKIKKDWVDSVFRKIRSLGNLEHSIIVLVTAEIIAAVYYQALKDATQSKVLKKICDQILRDEEIHLAFQAITLNHFYEKRSLFGKIRIRVAHRILMTGTILVVWQQHRKVLKAGGYSLFSFWKESFEVYFRTTDMIKVPLNDPYLVVR